MNGIKRFRCHENVRGDESACSYDRRFGSLALLWKSMPFGNKTAAVGSQRRLRGDKQHAFMGDMSQHTCPSSLRASVLQPGSLDPGILLHMHYVSALPRSVSAYSFASSSRF